MKKYLVGAIPFLANNEIVSWITLCILAIMFLADMVQWTTEGK